MTYVLPSGIRISDAVRRVMVEQLGRLQSHLRAGEIHDARKRIKEIRALLHLIRGPLGKERFTEENMWYRDAGRELSAARDAEATIETIDRLLEATDDQALLDTLRRARRRIDDQRRRLTNATNTAALAKRIDQARARHDAWPLIPDDADDAFGKGRDRTRRATRRALERAEASRSPEDFHELRKRAKDYWYHLRLLDRNKREQQEAEELSDLLGRQHDLVVAPRLIKDVMVAPIAQKARKELEEKALRAAHCVLG